MTDVYPSRDPLGTQSYNERIPNTFGYYFVNVSTKEPVTATTTTQVITTYVMRAWDTINLQYVFWTTNNATALPTITSPVFSDSANLTRIAIVHKI
jgi:hypothetical protein